MRPVPMLSRTASRRRVGVLHRAGYRVQQVTLPGGDVVVLRSKGPVHRRSR
jgi:hypothetical protein